MKVEGPRLEGEVKRLSSHELGCLAIVVEEVAGPEGTKFCFRFHVSKWTHGGSADLKAILPSIN